MQEQIEEKLGQDKKQIDHIELWLSKKCESLQTRDGYQWAWKKFEDFCKNLGYNPREIVSEYRKVKASTRNREQKIEKFKDELRDIIESYRSYLKTRNMTPLTVKNYLSVLQSFLRSSEIPIEIELPKRAFVKYHNRDLTKEDIRSIIEHVHSIRDKLFFVMMGESGMRPDTLCKLQYKHIKHDFENNIVPMKVELPSEILKYKVSDRFTFVGEDSIKILREYLKVFLPMHDEDYIFRARRRGRGQEDLEGQSTPVAFSTSFNRAVQKLKLDVSLGKGKPKPLHLYNLRKYFRNNLKNVDSGYINFWMGHSDNADMHYVAEGVEEHRRRYSGGYSTLRILEPTESDTLRTMEKSLADSYKTIGELKNELDRQKEQSITTDELVRLFDGTLPPDIVNKLKEKLQSRKGGEKDEEREAYLRGKEQ